MEHKGFLALHLDLFIFRLVADINSREIGSL